ncbi:septum formation protein [Abditibacterium utsteinense]|uniref:dTTP/UTP pyrophosphatase n=1 Tax=Abditibacterium utsteinense TaxID=1960156 RepID=A0A2S8SWZ7_9BACT|nr:Maf family protein [Abditibacterium utsteinense]PQV65320.1 septum formation protein [Abditibacterium utsteinense]
MPPIVLASASPRRSQLLRDLGVPFQIVPSHAVEPLPSPAEIQNPAAYVEKLAQLKAQSADNQSIIIGADTTVVLETAAGTEILGKPADEAQARLMLQKMRGKTHRVYSGVCVRCGTKERLSHQITRVTFGDFSDEFIAAYVQTGEPMDKAGAYAAQGKGALLIEKIEGDYFNVVGLPLGKLSVLLRDFGVDVASFWA